MGSRTLLGRLAFLPMCALLALAACGGSGGGGGGGGTTAPTLVSVQVTPANPSVAAGTTDQLTATATYSDSTHTDVTSQATWSSSNTAFSTVGGSTGLVSAVAVGTATVTATFQGMSGSTGVTVTAATLTSIAVTPAAPSIAKGTTQQFTAMGMFTDGSKQDVTTTVTWASDNTQVATIASSGLASGVAAGTANITATSGTIVSTKVLLTVTSATLVSIGITPPAPSIAAGTTQQFTATGTYSDNSTQNLTSTVTWSSGTTSVATINAAGLATSLVTGTSAITATSGSVHSSVTLTVTAAVLSSIQVTPSTPSVALGQTQQFVAMGVYSDGSHQTLTTSVTWASDNTAVATISNATGSNGLATSVLVGTANITATSGTIVSPKVPLTVTAAVLTSIVIAPSNPSIAKGLTKNFTATGVYSDSSQHDLTSAVSWHSGTPATATISSASPNYGLATSLAVGTTAITATLGSVTSNTSTLTVTAATLVSMVISPVNPTVPKGETDQFTATGTYTDTTTQNITSQVTWASDASGVASISNANPTNGLATGVTVGSAHISASLGSVNSTPYAFSVTAAVLTSISVTPTPAKVAVGATKQFTATGTYSDSTTANITASVTWNSDNGTDLTISSANPTQGQATGVVAGSAHVTAVSGSVTSNSVTVTVTTYLGYVYVTNSGGGDHIVSEFDMTANGTLTPMTFPSINTGNDPSSVTVDPSGKYAYVANYGDGTVSQYTIDQTTGQLTAMSPATVASGVQPFSVMVDPTGKYVYVANSGDSTVSQYTIGAGGALQPMTPAAVSTGTSTAPRFVTTDPTGKYAYTANYGNASVSQFTIAQTGPNAGALTAMSTPSIGSGNNPWVIAVDPTGTYAYVTNSTDNTVEQYTIVQSGATAGALSANPPPNDHVAAGSTPQFVTIDPSGKYVYVANSASGTISQYTITGNGTLSPMTPATAFSGTQPWAIAVDATGQFAFAPNNGAGTLSVFSVVTGDLQTPATTVATGTGGATSGPTSVVSLEP